MRRCAPLLACIFFSITAGQAAPFRPASDNDSLERLPFTLRDPATRQLRAEQARLAQEPENLPLALGVARRYLDLGRASGDPRYVGYAQAALGRWWSMARPPSDVLLLRAAMRQRVHLFDAALADLTTILTDEPRNAQARLMRATVLQVTGAFDAAREDCSTLSGGRLRLVRVACGANVAASTGRLPEAYAALRDALEAARDEDAALRSWALTMLGEMAERMDRATEAETHFRAALALAPDDAYALAAYADFLLDHDRPEEVEKILAGRERVDPLLLRLALAAQATHAASRDERVTQLRERFDASRLRGDAVHQREEARFMLHLRGDPTEALRLAKENWRVQKEPADLRILLEAAVASGGETEIATARDWLKKTSLQDAGLEKILSNIAHPN